MNYLSILSFEPLLVYMNKDLKLATYFPKVLGIDGRAPHTGIFALWNSFESAIVTKFFGQKVL